MISIITIIPFKNAYCEGEKVIYLTFDDGPGGKVTKDVLDILKSENVPATFFLIGNQIKGQEDLVKRIDEEGHSIGLHSMSHEKGNLYSSDSNFLKEMLDSQKTIEEVVGRKVNILRFPFGSNNNTYHLKESLVNLLHEN
ncbi:MAG: polysaccharide deacetylase family protein, partial [Clostridium sp.]|nr:polysaccharide deacetylase family protein [Clostridium sp.]